MVRIVPVRNKKPYRSESAIRKPRKYPKVLFISDLKQSLFTEIPYLCLNLIYVTNIDIWTESVKK